MYSCLFLSFKLLLVSTYNPGFWTVGYHGPSAPPLNPPQCLCPLHSESLCWLAQQAADLQFDCINISSAPRYLSGNSSQVQMNMAMISLILHTNTLYAKIRSLRKSSYHDNISSDRFHGISIQNDGFKRCDCSKYKWQPVIDEKDNLNFPNFKSIFFKSSILFIYYFCLYPVRSLFVRSSRCKPLRHVISSGSSDILLSLMSNTVTDSKCCRCSAVILLIWLFPR